MSDSPTKKGPRQLAVEALADRQGNVSDHLERLLTEHDLSPQDRGLAREIALGTTKRRATLRNVIKAYLRHPKKYLQRPMAEIMESAVYQLLLLDRVPDFAVVDEAVELARRTGHQRQAGFVNGVLRSIARDIGERVEAPPQPAVDVVPLDSGRYVKLARAVFVDPQAEPAQHIAQAWSLPSVLADRWAKHYGTERAWQLAAHAAERPPLIARVNTRLASLPEVLASLKESGVDARAHRNGRSVVLPGGEDVTRLAAFADGLIQPQDATATGVLAEEAALIRPGMAVLDFCAAPGTKTTQLAELMNNEGRIVAADVNEAKLERIAANCARMKVDIVETMLAPQVGSLEAGGFDVVTVDVPCSNTGVLARRAEARWRFSEKELASQAAVQKTLLALASTFVRPSGYLLYSTCSIEPEENRQVAQAAASQAGLKLLRDAVTLPAGTAADPAVWHDGGYRAVLQR